MYHRHYCRDSQDPGAVYYNCHKRRLSKRNGTSCPARITVSGADDTDATITTMTGEHICLPVMSSSSSSSTRIVDLTDSMKARALELAMSSPKSTGLELARRVCDEVVTKFGINYAGLSLHQIKIILGNL
jgi:hypothetical protein